MGGSYALNPNLEEIEDEEMDDSVSSTPWEATSPTPWEATSPTPWEATSSTPWAPTSSVPALDEDREALYAKFQPLVQRLIRQYGDTAELREDLKGEIYCRFHQALDKYDLSRGVPLKAYLVHQLSTSVYTYARKQWRIKKREVSLDEFTTERGDFLGGSDPTFQWDRNLENQRIMALLSEAIGRLTPRQRSVVIWRYYEAYSFEEIAELLEVEPATARSLLRHGLNRLRHYFAMSGACDVTSDEQP